MKALLIISILLMILYYGCNQGNKHATLLEAMQGIYVTTYHSGFSQTRDTLLIQAINESQFKITRRSYHEYLPERNRAPDYTITRWTASFDEDKKVLHVHQNGRILSFDFKNKLLIMGIQRYKKL